MRTPRRLISLALLGALTALADPAAAVAIDWVTVGDPGNACDTQTAGCFGSVSHVYRISKTEVTNAQYAEFLNAVDATGANALGLYDASMDSDPDNGGISFQAANANGAKYAIKTDFDEKPVPYVDFFDALRFANWLHNGQGSGSTETGAYTLLGGTALPSNGATVGRNAGAMVFLPSEDEWFKAAYYDPASQMYFDYPYFSDTATTCSAPTATPNYANCSDEVLAVTTVGAYTGSMSPVGTVDQGGNLWEWNEWTPAIPWNRGMSGGGFLSGVGSLASSSRRQFDSRTGNQDLGFRVASLVPEPGTDLLLITGALALAVRRRRR